MNIKQKPRLVIDPTTGLEVMHPYPLTREEAFKENRAKYWPLPTPYCPTCKEHHGMFTLTDIRTCCAQYAAAADYTAAVNAGEPVDPGTAHRRGLDYYWTWHLHKACGHSGKCTLEGKCYVCAAARVSPRQAALTTGAAWYMPLPGDECSNGHLAERRVTNGSCRQCEEDKKTRAVPMYRDPAFAALVMDRSTARSFGFPVYRTGEPCSKGHTGFRYVSTAGCIDCKEGR